jgi:signal transduction histidine kinase
MNQPLHVAVISRPGPERDAIVSALAAGEVRVFDGAAPFLDAELPDSGLAVVGLGVSAGDILRLGRATAATSDGWVLVLLEDAGNTDSELVARALSITDREPLSSLLSRAADPAKDGPILSVCSILQAVSRSRHDINNVLTSAMAETQLLLMDVQDPEMRESLEVIHEQLKRIRDLTAESSKLRRPPRSLC